MQSYFRASSAVASVASSTSEPPLATTIPIRSFITLPLGPTATWLYTTGALLITLLAVEQWVYRQKKQHLPGDKWTIPLIGKFADSMKPTMEGYMKQWNSGALSAISVFNMLGIWLWRNPSLLSVDFFLLLLQFHCYGLVERVFTQNSELTQPCRALLGSFCQANPHA